MREVRAHLDDKLYFRLKNGNHSINYILALGFAALDFKRALESAEPILNKEKVE